MDSGILSGFSINQLVSQHIALVSIKVILLDQVLNHLARRFPTLAFVIRGVRTNRKIFEGIEFVASKIVLQLPVDDVDIFQGKIASAYAGLIGHDEKLKAQLLKNLQGFHGVWEVFDIFHPGEVVLIQDDGSVSVEKDGFPCFNLLSLR